MINDIFARRRNSLRKLLKQKKLPPSILVSAQPNVEYLTGFTGSAGWLLIAGNEEVLISDSRYTIQISEECEQLASAIRVSKTTPLAFAIKTILGFRLQELCLESDSLIASEYQALESGLEPTVVGTAGLVASLRAIKDKSEIQKIKSAVALAEKSFNVIRAQLTGDQTESTVAHNLEHEIRLYGGKCCSFDPIVAVGPRAALPHASVTDKRIAESPFVLIDWGARTKGYVSDLTRVLITGKISPKFAKIYDVVYRAQDAAIKAIRPGEKFSDVDLAARKVIEDSGFGKFFGHGLGHGIGLAVHENPFLSQISSGELKAGMVVTVEPGVYLPNIGGVRIEDDVLVTKDGCQVLSGLPKHIDEMVVENYL